ncbi:kif21a protein, partial [Coemansia reversa NRRL 1564]
MTLSTVKVALRIRPLSPQEHINGETECVTQLPGVPQIVIGADRAFTFDHVFSPEVGQEQVYEESIRPLVLQFLQGYNATVLAYGQTGSGKTFSMGTGLSLSYGDTESPGVVPRAISEIWQNLESRVQGKTGYTYSMDISFLELYNEDLIDLLNPRSTAVNGVRVPTIREDSRGNMIMVGVERKPAKGFENIMNFLHQGALSRTTASTDMNRTSSRSHAIFTLYLRQQDRRSSTILDGEASNSSDQHSVLDSGQSVVSKIHFVDLAGSERIKRTGAAGNRAKEGISINAGLLALGNVISALGNSGNGIAAAGNAGNGNQQQQRRATHVPYRDSKLTRLLQDSLGGNSQTLMLACISPSDKNSAESLNTVRYANRARNIRNKVAVNFDKNSSVELSMLKTEIARLRGELSKLKLQRRQS